MLNDNHKKSLRTTFQSIDESLSRALMLLDSTREISPFSEMVPDATAEQRQVIADNVARIRTAMRNALDFYGISLKGAMRSSVWSAQVAILSANIDLEEIHPKRLRGYGNVSEDDAQVLTTILSQIGGLIDQAQLDLAHGGDGEIAVGAASVSNAGSEADVREMPDL